jgi:hypothetical protein
MVLLLGSPRRPAPLINPNGSNQSNPSRNYNNTGRVQPALATATILYRTITHTPQDGIMLTTRLTSTPGDIAGLS